jgi:thioester reductase-like protein
MKAKIAEYTHDLPQTSTPRKTKADTNKFSVAITSTTGYLGGRLLTLLTKNSRISRIHCLNSNPRTHQIFKKRDPQSTADVVFLHVNLASPDLGLGCEDYALAGPPRQTVPEHIVEDLSITINIGYAQSKHVAEHVLHAAS